MALKERLRKVLNCSSRSNSQSADHTPPAPPVPQLQNSDQACRARRSSTPARSSPLPAKTIPFKNSLYKTAINPNFSASSRTKRPAKSRSPHGIGAAAAANEKGDAGRVGNRSASGADEVVFKTKYSGPVDERHQASLSAWRWSVGGTDRPSRPRAESSRSGVSPTATRNHSFAARPEG